MCVYVHTERQTAGPGKSFACTARSGVCVCVCVCMRARAHVCVHTCACMHVCVCGAYLYSVPLGEFLTAQYNQVCGVCGRVCVCVCVSSYLHGKSNCGTRISSCIAGLGRYVCVCVCLCVQPGVCVCVYICVCEHAHACMTLIKSGCLCVKTMSYRRYTSNEVAAS